MKGQITKILSNLYFVTDEEGNVFQCNARGKFRIQNITPTVGDYVMFDKENSYILEILPRRNTLLRPLVSNIDQGLIVTSLKLPDFSTNLLDKLILIMEHNGIIPIICITKMDLGDEKDKEQLDKCINYYKEIGYLILYNTNLERIKLIFKDKVTVFTGQTGSGKSTLLNKLDHTLKLDTNEISLALGRGKHTTRFVQLINLFGGKVLDTPGFSLIDLTNMSEEDIRDSFIEFKDFPCRFKNCRHINEKECSVKDAVLNGRILESRYENYKKFIEKK